MDESTVQKVKEAHDAIAQAQIDFVPVFMNEMPFTFGWWIKVAEVTLPWTLWIVVRKKESTSRLLFVGFYVMIISCYLDYLGISYGAWRYLVKLTPTIPSYIPWDFSMIPVFVLLLIQFKQRIHYLWKALFFGLFTSFVAEPFYKWIGHYDPKEWKYVYSLPIYMAIYIIADWLSKRKSFEPI
ncbi:CBO0543 family protein [Paenibacillus silvisoli]|uniref:CBO0543 family protein n=1 Tax=Paenibacillus silvisoli TaxID=3110539 RepID=UPI0028060C90|nr:CBO0543 family protein [Paenibacillus silvisoli]